MRQSDQLHPGPQTQRKSCHQGLDNNPIPIHEGCFQVDALSPIIFLIMFQPVISHIQLQQVKLGYDLNGTKVITTPFKDNFAIITRNNKMMSNKMSSNTSWVSSSNRRNVKGGEKKPSVFKNHLCTKNIIVNIYIE